MVKILVFDTETTGLPPFQVFEENYLPQKNGAKWETWYNYNSRLTQIKRDSDDEKKELENDPSLWENYKETWPYIVQLSYIMFDTDTNDTTVRDVYIDLPPKFTTPEYIATAHPITRAAIESGQQVSRVIVDASIEEFMGFFRNANIVTGHNINFDVNMLLAECVRTGKTGIFDELIAAKKTSKIYCTACKATNLVNICYTYNCKKSPPIFKTPKLNQAYFRMFGYAPNESALHNALIDVVACLRVFYRMWFQGIQFGPMPTDVTPVCGVGEPDIYLVLKDIMPVNPIVQIINDFTPSTIDPSGIGSIGLNICEPIDNDILESIMTNKPVEEIKRNNEITSRAGRYKNITGINPFSKRGGKKSKKKSKRKRIKTNKMKSGHRKSNSNRLRF